MSSEAQAQPDSGLQHKYVVIPVPEHVENGTVKAGFPFFGLLAAQYTPRDQTLALQWQGAQVRIQGPCARDFFIAFAKGSATGIKANGADILSVQLIEPSASYPAHSP